MTTPMTPSAAAPRHTMNRVRHETRRRLLTVSSVFPVTPRMLRIVLTSPELHDFVSAAPDDHIKVFFPATPGSEAEQPRRDFTPRAFDCEKRTLTIDFAMHEAGPAMDWARQAEEGQTIEIGGPRGSLIIPDDFDWYLLIGDETALPAIGRRVEELRPGVPVTTAVVVAGTQDVQSFAAKAAWTGLWAFRNGTSGGDAALLQAVLAGHRLPPGDGFVWIAAEAGVARALRTYIVEDLGHPLEWTKASGYWKQGAADTHETI